MLRNHHEAKDLEEVQDLVDDLKQLQPQGLATLALQVELYVAQKQLDSAAKLIEEQAARPNLTPAALKTLANLAEKYQKFELAEQVYQQLAKLPTAQFGKLELATFLGRRHQVKEALDICEPLWPTTHEPEMVAAFCIGVLDANKNLDLAPQVDRVSGWLEQALAKPASVNPKSKHLLVVGLGNIREMQNRYSDAEALYAARSRKAIAMELHATTSPG